MNRSSTLFSLVSLLIWSLHSASAQATEESKAERAARQLACVNANCEGGLSLLRALPESQPTPPDLVPIEDYFLHHDSEERRFYSAIYTRGEDLSIQVRPEVRTAAMRVSGILGVAIGGGGHFRVRYNSALREDPTTTLETVQAEVASTLASYGARAELIKVEPFVRSKKIVLN